MTAQSPDIALRRLAGAPKRGALRGVIHAPEEGDRIFVTLLSLNFMLLAFFVVLGTAASTDTPRAASVAKNVRLVFAAPDKADDPVTVANLTARQAFHAGVSEAFAAVLPKDGHALIENGDRIDLAVPHDVFTDSEAETLERIAKLLRAAPTGLRYDVMIDGGTDTDVATIADGLLTLGVPPATLLLGAGTRDGSDLRFSFLLLDAENDGVAGPALAWSRAR
jgi:hypothetical protein